MKLCMVVWVVNESLSTKFSLQISHVNFTARWCRFVCLSTSVAFTPMKLHRLQGIVFGVCDFFTWAFSMNCWGYVFSQVGHLKGLWIPWTILRCATNLVTKWNFSWHRSHTFSFPSNLKVQFKIEIILERATESFLRFFFNFFSFFLEKKLNREKKIDRLVLFRSSDRGYLLNKMQKSF